MSDNAFNSAQDSGASSPTQHDPAHLSATENDALNDQEQVHAPNTDSTAPVLDTAIVQKNNPEPYEQLNSHQPPTSTTSQTNQSNPPITTTAPAPAATVPTQTPCYTTCHDPSSTTTITCANPACPRQRFHLPCARLQQAPDPSSNWLCTLCTGWAAVLDRDPDDPGDDVWRCPRCHAEVVHEDAWLYDSDDDEDSDDDDDSDSSDFNSSDNSSSDDDGSQPSQELLGCESCELSAGEPWEPKGKDDHSSFAAELAEYRAALAAKVKREKEARNKRALARAQRGLV
jgi:hypothetical protein